MHEKIIAILVLFFVLSPVRAFSESILRLATTTSTYETGLLENIIPPFEEKYKLKVHIISVGTGKAIKLAENGDVDAILVHAPEAEKKFVKDGYGLDCKLVLHNDFLILGPKDDPAGVKGLKDAKEALLKIHDENCVFVSRGDDSGTDKKDKYLWKRAGVSPDESVYLETGQGMSATLRVADEKEAYVLVDRATYLFQKDKIRLVSSVEGDKDLINPYSVIAVNPNKHSHVKYDSALNFIDWLTSEECRKSINGYRINDQRLFYTGSEN